MTFATLFAILPALFGYAGMQSAAPEMRVRTMTIEQQVIMRIPVQPRKWPQQLEWIEKKGPKCIPAAQIRGALLSGTDHVDFVMNGRQRLRAELGDDCPALDFYGGFYLSPEDNRICSRRDSIRNRMGGSCTIERFRLLEPRLNR